MNLKTKIPQGHTQLTAKLPSTRHVAESTWPQPAPLADLIMTLQTHEAQDEQDRRSAKQAALVARQLFD